MEYQYKIREIIATCFEKIRKLLMNCISGGSEMPSEGFHEMQNFCVALQWEMPVQNKKSLLLSS